MHTNGVPPPSVRARGQLLAAGGQRVGSGKAGVYTALDGDADGGQKGVYASTESSGGSYPVCGTGGEVGDYHMVLQKKRSAALPRAIRSVPGYTAYHEQEGTATGKQQPSPGGGKGQQQLVLSPMYVNTITAEDGC